MDYQVEFKPRAAKDLKNLSPEIARRVIDKIAGLEHDLGGDVKRLTNFTTEYRLRAGEYRVLFEVAGERVVIYRILHRKEAYR
jgi:mRNA interferase RelE/StbE